MSFMMNATLPLPITNGLSWHKSGEDWGGSLSKSSKRKSRYPPCECCPYGYHIDLDFVRFCETLAQGVNGDAASKQRRKERRRQRKSMEVLLGLNSPPSWSSDRDMPQFLNEPLMEGTVLECSSPRHSPVRDELQKAVLDFEDTLQRSQTSSKKSSDVADVGSTFYLPLPDTQDLDNGNNSAGLSANALQNIREQMAQSLERMRELEEQVKAIPVLQIQLSVLKDEKRKLLEKLKASEKKIEVDSENADLNSIINKKYHTLPLKSGFEMKTPYISETALVKKPSMRDVSVSCIAMMRDVGISHSEPPVLTRDVGVSHSPPPLSTRDIAVSPLPHVTTRDVGVNSSSADFKDCLAFQAEGLNSMTRDMVSLRTIIKKSEFRETGTVTDLLHNQIYSDVELDKNINKAIKMFEKTYLNKIRQNRLENVSSIGIQVSPPADTLKIIEKSDRAVQAVPDVRFRSYGVNSVVKMRDAQVNAFPETHSVGVSEDTLDIRCERCANGLNNLTNGESDKKTLSLAHLSVVRSKSFDYSDRSPLKKLRTRSIACGTTFKMNSTKSCDTSDLTGRNKDVGVNTVKRKLVDTAVGDPLQQAYNVNICDKCSNTIKSVAKNILNQSRGDLTTSLPVTPVSRIPRPTTLPSLTSSNDKPKLTRQDTYTKTFITPVPAPADKHSLSWLKDQSSSRSYCVKRAGSSSDDGSDDGHLDDTGLPNDHGLFEPPLFQPIQSEPRKKAEPSKEMRAAMKVLNDALAKSPSGNLPPHMKNAINIIQQEWFKISSTANANPLDVEDYLDCLEEISSRLLEYVVNMTDVSGNTAMHYAVSHGNFDVVSILLDSKVCNINQTNAAGYTCIMLVSLAQVRSETHRQVIKRLFQMADVNIRAKQHGQTALMLAVSHGRLDMVQLLLECGADMNIQDEDGSTALMCAAEHHHVEIVKLLLAQPDCDLTVRDYDGQTALNIAMEAGNRDIGVLLYAQEHFSRGSSPYTSLKHRRAKSTTPTLRTPTSPQPRTKQDHSY